MSDPLNWLTDDLEQLRDGNLLRDRREVRPLADGWCEVGGRRLRSFASNDYLNLAHDGRLIAAAGEALAEAGVGSRASALVVGRTDWQVKLEERLTRFEQQEAAVIFPSGYAANTGSIAALVGKGDVVFSDQLNHASLIDGCRLSRAEVCVYPHRDVTSLEADLKTAAGYRRRLIVTDSLFSMDGSTAPLEELCDLAEQYEAALLIDEAHATGVFGENGRGIAEWLGVEDRVTVRIGTLSKALGTLGGFVCGSRELVDWLWNRARPHAFSTALPPSVCAAACAAVDIVQSEPWRRERLQLLGVQLREGLSRIGVSTPAGSIGPIVPVILNEPGSALSLAAQLEEEGLLVAAIRPPTVPAGTSRLRITLSCAHDDADVTRLLDAMAKIMKLAMR